MVVQAPGTGIGEAGGGVGSGIGCGCWPARGEPGGTQPPFTQIQSGPG
jgi:hypothetical protein